MPHGHLAFSLMLYFICQWQERRFVRSLHSSCMVQPEYPDVANCLYPGDLNMIVKSQNQAFMKNGPDHNKL